MYHELVSKKALCSGVELLHGSNHGPLSRDRLHVNSIFTAFLEETSKDLKSYLDVLVRKRQQCVASVVPQRKKKKHRCSNVPAKGVHPMADLLTTVHGVLTLCSRNEYEHAFKVCFASHYCTRDDLQQFYEVISVECDVER